MDFSYLKINCRDAFCPLSLLSLLVYYLYYHLYILSQFQLFLYLYYIIYYIAGNFGKVFNLTKWVKITKLKTRQFKLDACTPMILSIQIVNLKACQNYPLYGIWEYYLLYSQRNQSARRVHILLITRKLRLHYGDFVQANFNMAENTAGQLEPGLRVNKASAKTFEPRTI